MNISRPRKEDLDAAWKLNAFLEGIAQGLNPLYKPEDPDDVDDFEYLEDADAEDVFRALTRKLVDCNLSWLLLVLDTLLSESNGLVDHNTGTLDFSPKLKQALSDSKRLDWLLTQDAQTTYTDRDHIDADMAKEEAEQ